MKLVFDLEQKALDPKISITVLLRTALTVAVKLNTHTFEEWINNELNGYYGIEQNLLPSYRFIDGVARYKNPFHGWCDVVWANQEQYDSLKSLAVFEKISEIEEFASSNDVITQDFPVNLQRQLAHSSHGIVPKIIFGKHKFVGILDSVKNNVLRWALDLERKGILGEDMVFNDNERKAAEHITINNYIGRAEHSNFQQGMTNNMKIISNNVDTQLITSLLDEIKKILLQLSESTEKEEIIVDITTIEQQLKSPNPKSNIVLELLKSIRNIMEGMGGNLLATYPAIENGFRAILG